ncbi:MAG: Gfo/Idh/MocA family oxidoreductase [Chryseobacterium sp.]|jgi:predicted dehydrogenase|uniref:Gfo/Idh/MocA family protein n=1 Tax=Chryseobacterium sp. TaxID=1871047 RepID=UPI0026241C57|nr:Gfo/Idh/MocA family oxidoreductase [Chryseobacterium sp.]MDF2551369.1 Gfo/Idh/MocA family oxidoreductase [Chryseobacterium sp.]
MKTDRIRVGIIGLNPDSHWASKSHIPALQFLEDDFEILGVANTTYESAKRASEAFQIPYAFQNAEALISSPEIDLVIVTVKVPYHFELVKAALASGKHVYCEHPLGNGLEETRLLAEMAAKKNVVAVVGTQMVVAPEILYLQQLIKDSFVGKVLSTTLIGSGGNWRNETVADLSYLYDKANGATMLTIPLAHTLAGVTTVLGSFSELSSKLTSNFDTVKVLETGDVKSKTAEDQIMIIGTLDNGAAISVHYRGGVSRGTNLLWEINGTEGDIQVRGDLGHGQLVPLSIFGAKGTEKELKLMKVPAEIMNNFPENPMVGNVARMYKLLADDIRNNTRNAPSFDDAVQLYELLNTIELSATKLD